MAWRGAGKWRLEIQRVANAVGKCQREIQPNAVGKCRREMACANPEARRSEGGRRRAEARRGHWR